jgi:hypothetical protein
LELLDEGLFGITPSQKELLQSPDDQHIKGQKVAFGDLNIKKELYQIKKQLFQMIKTKPN